MTAVSRDWLLLKNTVQDSLYYNDTCNSYGLFYRMTNKSAYRPRSLWRSIPMIGQDDDSLLMRSLFSPLSWVTRSYLHKFELHENVWPMSKLLDYHVEPVQLVVLAHYCCADLAQTDRSVVHQ